MIEYLKLKILSQRYQIWMHYYNCIFYIFLSVIWSFGGIESTFYSITVLFPYLLYLSIATSLILILIFYIIYGLNSEQTMFAKHLGMWAIIKATMIASGKDGQYPIFMLLLILYVTENIINRFNIEIRSTIMTCILYYYTAENCFFSKGLEESYANIPFRNAYLGFPKFYMPLVMLLVFFNVFGAHLTVLLWIYNWTFTTPNQDKSEIKKLVKEKDDENNKIERVERTTNEIFTMYTYLICLYLVSTICSFIMVQHAKLHLHFTELYAPNFIYRTVKGGFLFLSTIVIS